MYQDLKTLEGASKLKPEAERVITISLVHSMYGVPAYWIDVFATPPYKEPLSRSTINGLQVCAQWSFTPKGEGKPVTGYTISEMLSFQKAVSKASQNIFQKENSNWSIFEPAIVKSQDPLLSLIADWILEDIHENLGQIGDREPLSMGDKYESIGKMFRKRQESSEW